MGDPLAEALRYDECHGIITRAGEQQPCEKPTTCVINDPGGGPWPACVYHAHRYGTGRVVTLAAVRAWHDAQVANLTARAETAEAERDQWRKSTRSWKELYRRAEARVETAEAKVAAAWDEGRWRVQPMNPYREAAP